MYQLIQYGVLTVLSTFIVLRYSAPSVTFHVKFWSILTWILNFGIALLVPQDTYETLLHPNQSTPVKQWISIQYLILYWSVYILTWTIIPVLQEWENSGDLKSSDRLKRSLKVNGIFYLWMIIGGVIVLVLLVTLDVAGDMGLMTFLKCIATCWGIFLQIIMMGYAIVEIPRSLNLNAQPEKKLIYCYANIPQTDQQVNQAIFEFKQICSYILHMKQIKRQDKQIQQYCNISMSLIPEQLKIQIPTKFGDYLSHLNYLQSYPLELQSAIQHHRLMKRILARIRRLKLTLSEYVNRAIFCEEIVNAKKSNTQLQSDLINVTPFKSVWHLKIYPLLNRVAALFLTLFGILLTIAQTQVFITNDSSFLRWLLVVKNLQIMRVLVFIVIGLISYMVYYSLFRIKLSNLYGMYEGGSDGPSIMFATINFSRVGVAIVLNFFDMIKLNSIYKQAMSTVNMGLLGKWVINGIPGVLWLIILCHYFDLWGWCIKKFKLSDDWKFKSHNVDEHFSQSQPFQVTRRKAELKKISSLKQISSNKINLQQRLI